VFGGRKRRLLFCSMTQEEYNNLSARIIGCAIAVHRQLGPGLFESAYRACLVHELKRAGMTVQEQVKLPVIYDENRIPKSYVIDMLIEDVIVIEIKAVEELSHLHFAQTLTYLKIGDYKLGLLLNFNVRLMKDGIQRLVYRF
jgi:GxxExxY protein